MSQTRNQQFFALADSATSAAVLQAISAHYECTVEEALEEVTHAEAESLLDYLTGQTRTMASLAMRMLGIAA